MSRLHTYGCSFTVGLGPSWAHILAHNYDEHIQHAKSGVGNLYILKELVNTELEATDTVMIMWTYPTRHDFIESDEYRYNEDGQQWQSETYIKAAEQICKLKGCAYKFFSYGPWYKDIPAFLDHVKMSNIYIPSTKVKERQKLKTRYEMCAGTDWPTHDQWIQGTKCAEADKMLGEFRQQVYENRTDFHPTTGEFAEFLIKLGYTLTENQTKFVDIWQYRVLHSDDISKILPTRQFYHGHTKTPVLNWSIDDIDQQTYTGFK